MTGDRLRERRQSNACPSGIYLSLVLDRHGRHLAVVIPIELRSVNLRSPFEHADAIGQIGKLRSWCFAGLNCRCEKPKAAPLKCRQANSMLRDQPMVSQFEFTDFL